MHRAVTRRPAVDAFTCGTLAVAVRHVAVRKPPGADTMQHYSPEPKMKAGVDTALKSTEFYDGFTDDFGVFKEGPPSTLRLEYLRAPEHVNPLTVHHRYLWSPFETGVNLRHYTPFFFDATSKCGKDYFGKRSGSMPGMPSQSRYVKKEFPFKTNNYAVNYYPQKRVPKWLACIVHDRRRHGLIGFFLYANGAYAAELLTYKLLPRLTYNKPFQGFIPTIGQTVDLKEVTYGKEISVVEKYPGYGGAMCRSGGTAAVVLRGTEPGLVPLLLPSKEVRLFESSCAGTFGRRAGVMGKNMSWGSHFVKKNYKPRRPQSRNKQKRVCQHPQGGGNGAKWGLTLSLDWKVHPNIGVKTKYWLSGYILRGYQYNKRSSVADLKAKTYSWANRDPVYR